jgi:hypothetical protein
MGFTGLEPIIDKVLVELAANLPAKLAALEAALTPALTLTAPAAAEYTFGERQIHTTYPAIEVFPVTSPVDLDSNDTLIVRNHVGIAIFVRHADAGSLTRLLLRYARAVLEVLADRRAAHAFDPVGVDLNDQVLDWSPTRVAERTLLERDVMFAVRATSPESRN